MSIEIRSKLVEQKTHARIMDWLADGCTPEGAELDLRLVTLADLAEEFAEDCRALADEVRKERGE